MAIILDTPIQPPTRTRVWIHHFELEGTHPGGFPKITIHYVNGYKTGTNPDTYMMKDYGKVEMTGAEAGQFVAEHLHIYQTVAGALYQKVVDSGMAGVITDLDGEVHGQSSVSGALYEATQLSGTIAGSLGLSGDLLSVTDLGGSIGCSASVGGNLKSVTDLGGDISAQSSVSAELSSSTDLSGAASCTSSLSGNMKSTTDLGGDIDASSLLTGDLTGA